MNTPKFHVATTIDGITVDIRVAIDPVEAKLSPDAFYDSGSVIAQADPEITKALHEQARVVTYETRAGIAKAISDRRASRSARYAKDQEDARKQAREAAATITDPIIKKLEAANEKLRLECNVLGNEVATYKAAYKTAFTKPRRAKKGGAK